MILTINAQIIDGPLTAAAPLRDAPGAGAVVCFEGVVRPSEGGRPIVALVYQTYDPMAQQMLADLAGRAVEQFGLIAVRVEHSRGRVGVDERSFRLIVASKHRKAALAAMDWYIDRLKQDVPIWKQPVYAPAAVEAQR